MKSKDESKLLRPCLSKLSREFFEDEKSEQEIIRRLERNEPKVWDYMFRLHRSHPGACLVRTRLCSNRSIRVLLHEKGLAGCVDAREIVSEWFQDRARSDCEVAPANNSDWMTAVPWGELYALCQQLSRQLAARLPDGVTSKEDLSQDTALAILDMLNRGRIDPSQNPRGLVRVIARRIIASELKKQYAFDGARKNTVHLEEAQIVYDEIHSVMSLPVNAELQQRLAELDSASQHVLRERLLNGKTFAEIGASCGVSAKTAWKMYNDALERLRF